MSYGIEWLIVDKFIKDKECRQILCDRLGERMSLIYEYGDRREQKGWDEGKNEGIKEIVQSFITSGTSLEEISQKTGKPIKELKKILND